MKGQTEKNSARTSKNHLLELKNISKTIASRLNELGILTLKDLKRVGSREVYRSIRESNFGATTPKCYYLYSIEGAIQNRDWRSFSPEEKKQLARGF